MCAIALANSFSLAEDDVWQSREQEYMTLIHKYKPNQWGLFREMREMLSEALARKMDDSLGDIYMGLETKNNKLKQFFTPYSICRLAAETAIETARYTRPNTIYEPTCGSGGMIIATAELLRSKGINYQKMMRVLAQDLDVLSVSMCYTQLSLLGIDGVVLHGDTLEGPGFESANAGALYYTPARRGILL